MSAKGAHVDVAFGYVDAELAAQFGADFELQGHFLPAGGEILAHRGLRG